MIGKGLCMSGCFCIFRVRNRNLAGFARNVKRVGATLAVAPIQGGGKPRPYNDFYQHEPQHPQRTLSGRDVEGTSLFQVRTGTGIRPGHRAYLGPEPPGAMDQTEQAAERGITPDRLSHPATRLHLPASGTDIPLPGPAVSGCLR